MDLQALASYHFDLDLPTSSISLKKAYRRQCLKLHPDVGGDARLFKEMQAAYNELMTSEHILSVIDGEAEYTKEVVGGTTIEDGTPLTHLGLGLGPTVNGTDCPECKHRGYQTSVQYQYATCPSCSGAGRTSSEPCRACKGTGKFTQERSRRVVNCRVCSGTGSVKFKKPTRSPYSYLNFFDLLGIAKMCSRCHGTGTLPIIESAKTMYHRCHKCSGTGELPMWNPVIPKGMLNSRKEKKA
jgi:DnaJ-class molecular chaperone